MKTFYIFLLTIACMLLDVSQTIAQVTQTINRELTDERGNLYLLGKSSRERLQQAPFDAWFHPTYNNYAIDSATAARLKPLLAGKRFRIFMGTWCGDSRREVPRIYKLLDHCGVPASHIELINVDNHDTAYKQSPGHEEQGLDIHRVPDLLVFENEREMGRVVESPVVSWEKDLLSIVQGENYIPRYRAVPQVAAWFRSSPLPELEKRLQQLAEEMRPLVQSRAELQSYAQIQMALKETDKALLIYRLNALLFPNDSAVWNSLAAAYRRQ